ncbi:GAF and ANTAR domain-containing protein [Actinomadura parmotrematis]|uniref:GAF and ANTAR domain-containing protein n=1 Tax=Actinomadura parmotrematis TaxID=2864039 RepID=A0ABS7FKC6_9ACTN|nr:GAF and ANTAR domain-containing protein [Actinomadura parmotrematis]MBW8480814.1 GAF and ANTAR domain-containing protein [Actinomadura parmotrematis]
MAAAFIALADTLVTDFDVIEFLQQMAERSVDLLGIDAAGLLVTDQNGRLRLVATSNDQTRMLELFQLQNRQGPCLDAFTTGRAVHCADLGDPAEAAAWPLFAARAGDSGFAAVSALPMRLRDQVIGALNLFRNDSGPLAEDTVRLGQAMADIATIGLLQERTIRHGQVLTDQLQTALTSRVVIEQAKGVLAERHGWTMDQAFTALRGHARDNGRPLTALAQTVVSRGLGEAESAALAGRVPRSPQADR